MGVDFLICTLCNETFPDCGDYMMCADCCSRLCSDCMEDYEQDDDGIILDCPVCTGVYDENRVFIHDGKDHFTILWARTPEEVAEAYAWLFDLIREHTTYYNHMNKTEQAMFKKACEQRGDAIKDFLGTRVGYEDESFYFETVKTP